MGFLDNIVGFVSKMQLSFTQYLILALATAISGLVAVLKIQGSALHKAQVDLLEQHIQGVDQADDAAVKAARDRFMKAYYTYNSAREGK
jgi:hypothetical protein